MKRLCDPSVSTIATTDRCLVRTTEHTTLKHGNKFHCAKIDCENIGKVPFVAQICFVRSKNLTFTKSNQSMPQSGAEIARILSASRNGGEGYGGCYTPSYTDYGSFAPKYNATERMCMEDAKHQAAQIMAHSLLNITPPLPHLFNCAGNQTNSAADARLPLRPMIRSPARIQAYTNRTQILASFVASSSSLWFCALGCKVHDNNKRRWIPLHSNQGQHACMHAFSIVAEC